MATLAILKTVKQIKRTTYAESRINFTSTADSARLVEESIRRRCVHMEQLHIVMRMCTCLKLVKSDD